MSNGLHPKLARAFGPAIVSALSDPDVVEIMVNEDGIVRLEKLGGGGIVAPGARLEPAQVKAALHAVAHLLGKLVREDSPILEGEIPGDGSRIEGVVPPCVAAPVMCIRRRASRVFDLDSYVSSGRMTADMRSRIGDSVRKRHNLLVVGGTGSGKTTLVNAIIREISAACPDDRLVIIEDTVELQCASENYVQLRTSDLIDAPALLRASLRLRPTRILVGEVRGGEANTLIKAWNTGHPGGVATVHANGAEAGLLRLEQMAAEGGQGYVPREAVAEAVDRLVFVTRGPNGPLVRDMREVQGVRADGYVLVE